MSSIDKPGSSGSPQIGGQPPDKSTQRLPKVTIPEQASEEKVEKLVTDPDDPDSETQPSRPSVPSMMPKTPSGSSFLPSYEQQIKMQEIRKASSQTTMRALRIAEQLRIRTSQLPPPMPPGSEAEVPAFTLSPALPKDKKDDSHE